MAETRITNVVVPEIFTQYTVEPSIYKSRLFQSGAIANNPIINNLLAGGGETFNLPFWKDVGGTSGDVPSETVATTVNNLSSGKQIARRQFREKAWGSNDLAGVLAGDKPLDSLQNMVVNYWAQALEMNAVACIQGVFADDIADSSDLVNDISGGVGAAAIISDSAVIDAQALLGENGTVGRNDLNGGNFAAIVIHPATYAVLRKANAFDYLPIGDQERPVETYMGMVVIVTRNAPVDTGVYDSYIVKNGAIQYGFTTNGYEATEIDRDASTGFGIDKIYTRRVFAMHPAGMAWQEDTVTGGISPSDANLKLAANWDRVFDAENMGMVMLRHKLA